MLNIQYVNIKQYTTAQAMDQIRNQMATQNMSQNNKKENNIPEPMG